MSLHLMHEPAGEDGEGGGGSLAVKENSPLNEDHDAEPEETTRDQSLRLTASVKKEPADPAATRPDTVNHRLKEMIESMEEDEEKSVVTKESSSPLDFSVKCESKQRGSHGTADVPKDKMKGESFPLDLSVRRSSLSPNIPSPSAKLHPHHNRNPAAHPRQQQSLNSVAKFSSRCLESRNLSSSSSSPPSATSPFSSLTSRLSVNGSDKKKTFPSPVASSAAAASTRVSSSHGRQNPWQTQWINRSSEQTRDVFTCVWCKESFRSLQEMTMHMKESPRCGMAGMQHAAAASLSSSQSQPQSQHMSTTTTAHSSSSPITNGSKSQRNSSGASSSSHKEPMSNAVLAKNNVTLPRKLVRGQDVWLGRGAEQTRQILKCMWCAQSFKTLDEMTRHMRVTQHYTNIISQEQIISWRTPEDKLAQAQVNAVLTCKVCDEAFGSLKELSYHMVKNAHYKEHILRSITEGGHGRRRQTRERRKKSLPVRKLLELERMEMPSSSSTTQPDNSAATATTADQSRSPVSPAAPCPDCGRRVEDGVGHDKQCKGRRRRRSSPEAGPVSPSSSSPGPPHSRCQTASPPHPSSCQQPSSAKKSKPDDTSDKQEDGDDLPADEQESKSSAPPPPPPQSSSACLSALQSLIDKSFDVKAAAAAAATSAAPATVPHKQPSGSHHHHHSHDRRVNGSRASSHRKLPLAASLSAVEKWMTLAKERDAPPTSMWSSSVSSSSSSSWLCSDEEETGSGNKQQQQPPSQSACKVPSPGGCSGSRPSSVSSPIAAGDDIAKHAKKRDDVKDSVTRNEDAERREEIEELKRSANNNTSEPESSKAAATAASSSASLSALERLIEKSFDSKKKNTPTGFLQRLGIDEEVCPPWQPGLGLGLTGMSFGHPFQPWLIPKHESGRSDTSSPSKGTKNGSLSSSPPV